MKSKEFLIKVISLKNNFSKLSKLKTFFALVSITTVMMLFQNFTLKPHEVNYTGGGKSLSSIVDLSSGTTNNKIVRILPNEVAYINQNINVDSLIIEGQLHCPPNSTSTYEIKAKSIFVNGLFQCGISANPFKGKLIITLKDSSIDPKVNSAYRGLIVNSNGKLILTGDSLRSQWTRITQTILKDDTTVKLGINVRNKWQINDKIVIAPSSYNFMEAETFLIKGISSDGQTITLDRGATYQHWGQTQTITTPKGRSVILDQRAEIANLTRNILIQPENTSNLNSSELGGHVMVNSGGQAYVDSIELYKMGQAGVMARYPFHWHMVGNAPNQFIKNSSIHDSFQRCITVHKTHQSLVTNNVCYNFKGHGFFLEDGDEINNTISYNLGIKATSPSSNKILLASDNGAASLSGVDGKRFPAVSTYWISNPQNTVINNVAAGSVGTGFWMAYSPEIKRFDRTTGKFTNEILARPQTTNTLAFNNNIAHSTQVGMTWDGAPHFSSEQSNEFMMNNPNNPADRKLKSSHYRPSQVPTFNNLIAYKNLQTGLYFRGQTVVFNNALLADNGWSMFFAYNQIVRNSVVVGRSDYHTEIEDNYLYYQGNGRFLKNQTGIVMYDGPFELVNVEFMNFPTNKVTVNTSSGIHDVTATPFFRIGGARKFTNIVQGLTFSPEPYYRVFSRSDEGWLDAETTAEIRDKDGSLTGVVGGLLVSDIDFNNHSNCSRPNRSGKQTYSIFNVCASNTSRVGLFLSSNLMNKIPFLVYRNDNTTSIPLDKIDSEFNLLKLPNPTGAQVRFLNKVSLRTTGYKYTLVLRPEDKNLEGAKNISVSLNAEVLNRLSPVVRMAGFGSNCQLVGATRNSSLSQLNSFNGDGFYSSGNDFYIRLKTAKKNHLLNASFNGGLSQDSDSIKSYKISCSGSTIKSVKGSVAEPTSTSSGANIKGWACAYNVNSPIDVHIYAGALNEAGRNMIASGKANVSNESNVSAECGTGKSNYRYNVVINENHLKIANGRKLYVYGISPNGGANSALGSSGTYNFPTALKKDVIGYVDRIVKNANGTGTVSGWACTTNVNKPIYVHLYLNGSAGTGSMLKSELADDNSESAISSRCKTTVAHRFNISLTSAQMTTHKNKTIYVHGISAVQDKNLLLTRSGEHRIP